jgi:cytolethal distending toxin subunit A
MNAFLSLRGLLAAKLLAAGLLAAAPIDVSFAGRNLGVLINGKTGKCLTIAGGTSPANNLTAVQFDCDGDPTRGWFLKDVGGDAVQIQNAKTGKCLTIAGGTSPQNNLEAVQFDCDSDLSRAWRLGTP